VVAGGDGLNPHLVARVRMAILLLGAILLQTSVGNDLRVLGVAPDLMVLLAILAGLSGGTESGAWVGFWAGLLTDMFLTTTPLGLSALTYCLVGASVGAVREGVLPESRALPPIVALGGTVTAVLLFVGFGDVLGQAHLLEPGRAWLIRVAAIEGGWAAVLAVPVGWLYGRAARGSVGVERLGPPRSSRHAVDALMTR
jgi:rod shape-determining protein MreD